MGTFADDAAMSILAGVLSAISWLHQNGVIHRNINPTTVMFRAPVELANNVVLTSFTRSAMDEDDIHDVHPTEYNKEWAEFRAPETMNGWFPGRPWYGSSSQFELLS